MNSGELGRSDDASAVKDRVDRFRAARGLNPGASFEPFLPPPDSPIRDAALVGLVKADMELRAKAGQSVRVESYLVRFPNDFDEELPVELVAEEYRLRHAHADKPPLDEYYTRFPNQYDALLDALRHPADPTPTPEASVGFETLDSMVPLLPQQPRPAQPSPASVPAPASAAAPFAGQGYRLLKKIGKGTFGEVFEALAPGDIKVAVKRITQSADEPASKGEFEALEAVKSLSHPFLLKTHAYWVDTDNRLLIAMDLADGSLEDRCRECREQELPGVPPEELLPIFAQAAAGLDYLHKNRVTHRDIKPANILLLGGYAKLADFGLARTHKNMQTVIDFPQGTMEFMAPEVFGGTISGFSDQYSLAASYVKARLDRKLFPVSTPEQIIASHLTVTPDLRRCRRPSGRCC